MGRRAADREHPAGDVPRPPGRAARRPALAQGAHGRLRSAAARRLRRTAVRRLRDGDRRSSPRWRASATLLPPGGAGRPPNLVRGRGSRPRTRCSSSSSGRRPRSGRSSAAHRRGVGPDLAYSVNAVTFGDSALLVLGSRRLLQSDRPIGRAAGANWPRATPSSALAARCVRPGRLVDRHGRDRALQRRRGVPRQASYDCRRLRLRPALDGLRHRPHPRRARRPPR